MKAIAVSELKARLSEQIRRVKDGGELLVTERGRPVAVLGPPPRSDVEHLEELQNKGVVQLGRKPLSLDFWKEELVDDPEGGVLEALLEERREGR